MSSNLQKEWASSYLSGGSMAYVDSLYEDYLKDPNSVPEDWKKTFNDLAKADGKGKDISHREIRDYFLKNADKKKVQVVSADVKQAEVAHLINAYRTYGHLIAKLDPLEMTERPSVANLELAYHHLSDDDKNVFFCG
ncbi:2-oxoglutarate dehydrogenase [Legionella oakridgensis ATCC 33761 = DSM 21215]|uniref:2-oxoglutarate dehydrogenase n=1 Tax=Legionella oakridgensis ATCC 33761 = DSM 21215 TaxID=1268635 RepID=W0BBV3_9GAMM|nr:2-oxoglutarate dehydrogenase [Legionella oakridgensis ATCC 33761 = DSM 21215]